MYLQRTLPILSLLLTLVLAVTDYTQTENQTPELQVLWKETQKRCVTMELNKVYAFRQRYDQSLTAHTTLVVGHIFKDDEDDDSELWDFEAFSFDLVYIKNRPLDGIYGGKCINRANEWECRDSNTYKFKGEVDVARWERVEQVVGQEGALFTSVSSNMS